MLKKIISGGQTGADRAALDFAIKFNIEHGGWIPKGRRTENGPLPLLYELKEMDTQDYKKRTRQNILDSHGTIIIFRGKLTGGSKLTQSYAKVIGRPNCSIDLLQTEEFEAALIIKSFISENFIQVLNVAGPRMSHQPWIYNDVKTILEASLYLFFMDTRQDRILKDFIPAEPVQEDIPKTLNAGIDILCKDLPFKTKVCIAKFDIQNIHMIYFTVLEYIRRRLGFDSGNDILLKDCSARAGYDFITVEDAVMVVLKQLKQTLEKEYILRVVK